MTSGHPENYTTLTDVTISKLAMQGKLPRGRVCVGSYDHHQECIEIVRGLPVQVEHGHDVEVRCGRLRRWMGVPCADKMQSQHMLLIDVRLNGRPMWDVAMPHSTVLEERPRCFADLAVPPGSPGIEGATRFSIAPSQLAMLAKVIDHILGKPEPEPRSITHPNRHRLPPQMRH